jgi:hypothetical protein
MKGFASRLEDGDLSDDTSTRLLDVIEGIDEDDDDDGDVDVDVDFKG